MEPESKLIDKIEEECTKIVVSWEEVKEDVADYFWDALDAVELWGEEHQNTTILAFWLFVVLILSSCCCGVMSYVR